MKMNSATDTAAPTRSDCPTTARLFQLAKDARLRERPYARNSGYDFEVPESMNATRSSICFEESVEPKFVGMIPFE